MSQCLHTLAYIYAGFLHYKNDVKEFGEGICKKLIYGFQRSFDCSMGNWVPNQVLIGCRLFGEFH